MRDSIPLFSNPTEFDERAILGRVTFAPRVEEVIKKAREPIVLWPAFDDSKDGVLVEFTVSFLPASERRDA